MSVFVADDYDDVVALGCSPPTPPFWRNNLEEEEGRKRSSGEGGREESVWFRQRPSGTLPNWAAEEKERERERDTATDFPYQYL